jgi:hypothetical protein
MKIFSEHRRRMGKGCMALSVSYDQIRSAEFGAASRPNKERTRSGRPQAVSIKYPPPTAPAPITRNAQA